MRDSTIKLSALACVLLLAAACSFDLQDHPTACKARSDCGEGYDCYQDFCVQQQGATDGGGGAGGSDDAGSMNGGDGGDSGAGGSSGNSGTGGTGGTGGTAGQDGGTLPSDAGDPPDATGDAAGQDSSVPAPPYAPCAGNGDCNAGETCRMTGNDGVCSKSCTSPSNCPSAPPGGAGTSVECDNGQCRIDCTSGRRDDPTCPNGMACVQEAGDPLTPWNADPQTCYP